MAFWSKPAPKTRELSHVWLLQGGEVRSLASPDQGLLEIFGAATTSGVATGRTAALTCSASFASIRLISDLVGELPLHVMRRGEDGNRERVREHAADVLMNSFCNPWTSGAELRRELTGTALLDGRGLARVLRTSRGVIREIHQIQAAVEFDQVTAEPTYKLKGRDGQTETLQFGDVIDVRALGAEAPAKLAKEAIEMALLLERYGKKFFENNGRPSGLLTFKAKVDATTATAVRAAWDDLTGGTLSGGPAVLGHDVTYTPLSFTSTDSQYLENRTHQTLEILRFFGLPPTLAGELQDASLNNSENMSRDFLRYTLSPWLSRWTEALTRCLLTPKERVDHFLRFETNALTAADLKSRMEAYQRSVGGPFMTPAEARQREDLPALAAGSGADKLNPVQGAAPISSPSS